MSARTTSVSVERAAPRERDVGVGAHVGALGGAQAGLAAHDDLGRALAVERLDLLRTDGGVGRGRPRRDERDERSRERDSTSVSNDHRSGSRRLRSPSRQVCGRMTYEWWTRLPLGSLAAAGRSAEGRDMQLKRLGVAAMTPPLLGPPRTRRRRRACRTPTVNAANARANNITIFYSGDLRPRARSRRHRERRRAVHVRRPAHGGLHERDHPWARGRPRHGRPGPHVHGHRHAPIRGRRHRHPARRHRRRPDRGGTGADAMFGDTGEDWATYSGSPAGVTVTLENAANDGVLNEGDNVSPTIENVLGSSFDDRIVGSASAQRDPRRGPATTACGASTAPTRSRPRCSTGPTTTTAAPASTMSATRCARRA